MPTFAGVNHLSLTVTDLDVSEHFYTEILDFIVVMDVGYGRICLHKSTGFFLGLIRHPAGTGTPFTELNTGLDHIGLTASTRDELVEWEQRFQDAGVTYTPIRDMELGHHLNFRDPDNIPLEFSVPNQTMTAALHELRTRDLTREEILSRAAQLVGAAHTPS
jgi:catechol 2,3-dioxygenase-like lactoylglutathione lyase family enzyme